MSLNANLDIKFKNYELLKENKMFGPLMNNLPDMLKNFGFPNQKRFRRVDMEKPQFMPDPEFDSETKLQHKNELSGLHDLLTLFSEVVKDKTQMVQLNVMLPNLGIFHATMKSKDMIQIPKLVVSKYYLEAKDKCFESDSDDEGSDRGSSADSQEENKKRKTNKMKEENPVDDDSSGDEAFKKGF